jgi:hypothetical protein
MNIGLSARLAAVRFGNGLTEMMPANHLARPAEMNLGHTIDVDADEPVARYRAALW